MAKDLIGQQLGNYRLVSLLGRGGFAEVYLGQHVDIPTLQAAIKVLHLTEVDTQKFRQEAAIIASLKHPHIIRLSNFSDRQELPFLVMDYAPNGSLRKRHPPGDKVPLATIVQYTAQIADALHYAHKEHNIIHRDIKPDNVLIGSREELLLSDFGIAVISETGRATLLAPYGTAGTPYYMAPEMFRGKPDKASDQYALAVMVYQWLSGTLPFDQGDFIQLGYQHTHEPVPPLRERAPLVPEDVETVVMTALAKDPKERFATVQAFATALEQASQPKQPVHGLLPSNTKPSIHGLPLPPTVPAPHMVQVMTQPGMDTPVEQPQPSIPKQPKPFQVHAKPQPSMPKRSPSSGLVARRKSKSTVWKKVAIVAVVAWVIAAVIVVVIASQLKLGLIATLIAAFATLVTESAILALGSLAGTTGVYAVLIGSVLLLILLATTGEIEIGSAIGLVVGSLIGLGLIVVIGAIFEKNENC